MPYYIVCLRRPFVCNMQLCDDVYIVLATLLYLLYNRSRLNGRARFISSYMLPTAALLWS